MTTDTHSQWAERVHQEHAAAVERGEHDAACEWRPGHYLCDCSKRRRELVGYTTPPGPLIHQAPLCPRCEEEVSHDGDCFTCPRCLVYWDKTGDTAHFCDDCDAASSLAEWESRNTPAEETR